MAKKKQKTGSSVSRSVQNTLGGITRYPYPKKPLEQVGKQIHVPGSFWSLNAGRMSAEESSTKFKCTIREYSAMQNVPGQQAPTPAFQLQEMGPSGTGSLEQGDASGEIFWLSYPEPFLECYYATVLLHVIVQHATNVACGLMGRGRGDHGAQNAQMCY